MLFYSSYGSPGRWFRNLPIREPEGQNSAWSRVGRVHEDVKVWRV